MSTASTMPVAPSQPALSEPERLINVFFAPTKTFADLRRNARWWVPWLIVSLISIGFTVVLDKQVGFEQISENQIKMSPKAQEKMEQLTAEQQQQRLHGSALFFKWVFGYLSPLTNLFFIIVIAGILLATFNFGVGT